MSYNSTNQSNPDNTSLLIEAIKNKLTAELKSDNFLDRLFADKYFHYDLRPDQIPDLSYAEIGFNNFHVECMDEICVLENLKWILPGKLLVHEPGNEHSVQFNTLGDLVGFITKIKYRIESIQDSNEGEMKILEFELTKPIPIIRG